VDLFRGVPAVVLGAGDLEATFLPGLGLLGASLRHRGRELLALPRGLAGYRSQHQTGLPLLAPWANRLGGRAYDIAGARVDLEGLPLHLEEHGMPIHGTMTAATGWELTAVERAAGWARLAARFDFGARPDLLASFPFPHELRVEAGVDGDALHLATTLRPTADVPVPVAFGYHPYLRLPGSRRRWQLELPGRRHLVLDGCGLPTGAVTEEEAERGPVGERTFDDLYALGPDRTLAVEARGLRVSVELEEGYPYAQVFAPPGRQFLCLEPMTAPTNALVDGTAALARPGREVTARFSIRVEEAGQPR
jgi:galactose mutarotase-like enzyme